MATDSFRTLSTCAPRDIFHDWCDESEREPAPREDL